MMKLLASLLLTLLALTAVAQTMYRWVDKDGQVHYTDRPPAKTEAAQVEKKQSVLLGVDQTTSYTLRKAMADYPVTLYTDKDCDPCKEGRNLLTRRGIPFTEKNVYNNDDLQAELKKVLAADSLEVPVMVVGRKVQRGFLASEWEKILDASGYPKAANR